MVLSLSKTKLKNQLQQQRLKPEGGSTTNFLCVLCSSGVSKVLGGIRECGLVEFTVLLFKILLAPVLIALVSLAGRKWGPGVSGWLLGIPLNSGPIVLFLVLEQGHEFAARTAVGALLGILAWSAFNLAYANACVKLSWWLSMLIGWAAYFLVAGLLLPVHLKSLPAFLLVVVMLAIVIRIFPEAEPPRTQTDYGRFDLSIRMATASLMVVTLTAFARLLGPAASGILSSFPAFTTILAVFSHHHDAAAAVHVLKGVEVGLYTAASFLFVISLALPHMAATAAFALAILAGIMVQGASLAVIRRSW